MDRSYGVHREYLFSTCLRLGLRDVGGANTFPSGYRWMDYDNGAPVEMSCVKWSYTGTTRQDESAQDDCEYLKKDGNLEDKKCTDKKAALCEFVIGNVDIVHKSIPFKH